MVFAAAALQPATERGVGLFATVRALPRGFADFLGPNHIAAANDHSDEHYASANDLQQNSMESGLVAILTVL